MLNQAANVPSCHISKHFFSQFVFVKCHAALCYNVKTNKQTKNTLLIVQVGVKLLMKTKIYNKYYAHREMQVSTFWWSAK